MLSAVPFRSDNVLFIILFGATQRFITTELTDLDISSLGIVFIHISDMDSTQLASAIRNDLLSIGLGPYHGYVRPDPCGPRPTFFLGSETNYLRTIGHAVMDFLRLDSERFTVFMINLSVVLRDLITYMGSETQTAPDTLVQNPAHVERFQPAQHLSTQHQTYAEFTMLLQEAANKQRDELRLVEAVLHDKDDMVNAVYCFEDTKEFVPWVEEWISPEPEAFFDESETCSSSTKTPDPETPRNSPFINTYSERENLASKKRRLDVASSPSTPQNSLVEDTDVEGRDLASKKRRLDWHCVTESFYDAGT